MRPNGRVAHKRRHGVTVCLNSVWLRCKSRVLQYDGCGPHRQSGLRLRKAFHSMIEDSDSVFQSRQQKGLTPCCRFGLNRSSGGLQPTHASGKLPIIKNWKKAAVCGSGAKNPISLPSAFIRFCTERRACATWLIGILENPMEWSAPFPLNPARRTIDLCCREGL